MTLIAGRTLCPQYSQRSVFTRALPAVEKRQTADGRLACVTAFNFLAAAKPNTQNPLSPQDVVNGLHGSSVVATMAAKRYRRWAPLVGICLTWRTSGEPARPSAWRSGPTFSPPPNSAARSLPDTSERQLIWRVGPIRPLEWRRRYAPHHGKALVHVSRWPLSVRPFSNDCPPSRRPWPGEATIGAC